MCVHTRRDGWGVGRTEPGREAQTQSGVPRTAPSPTGTLALSRGDTRATVTVMGVGAGGSTPMDLLCLWRNSTVYSQ